jgi:uncharacterized protein (DUF1810 family)
LPPAEPDIVGLPPDPRHLIYSLYSSYVFLYLKFLLLLTRYRECANMLVVLYIKSIEITCIYKNKIEKKKSWQNLSQEASCIILHVGCVNNMSVYNIVED